jgi:hypothetical protein
MLNIDRGTWLNFFGAVLFSPFKSPGIPRSLVSSDTLVGDFSLISFLHSLLRRSLRLAFSSNLLKDKRANCCL